MFIILIMWSIINGISTSMCLFDVRLSQVLLNQGFHRNISYKVTFSNNNATSYEYDNCYVGLDHTLPAGVYAYPDELGDLLRMNKIVAVPKTRVNIELPAEQSQSSSVFIIGNITDGETNLWLPVHARYHKAVKGGGLILNEIPSPRVFLRCPQKQIEDCEPTTTIITFLCDGRSKATCKWKELPYNLLTGPVSFSVPVGNVDHNDIVAPVTAGIVTIFSLYLLKTLHDYKISRMKKAKL